MRRDAMMKDIRGRIIGFDKLNVTLPSTSGLVVEVGRPPL
jgi:hypothetical protein